MLARGLSHPTGVAVDDDGSIYVSESGAGKVSLIDGGVSTLVEGLVSPQGIALLGQELLVLDTMSKELLAVSLHTNDRKIIASGLPVGSQPGVTPKLLMGIAGLIQGPLTPFSGLAVGPNGTIYVAADGEGSVLALKQL